MNPQQPTLPAPPTATDPRQQVLNQITTCTNVLLTVSENPTVDQLTAVIGMTLLLNKLGKHATAVFSGEIPSTIQFLQPEKTLEKTTDSLRDFIIALDKSKADKLRYKIEDKFVKIFITPYHTSLTDKDLQFSHGDFNIDVVLALGVKKRDDLDKTIVAHGRILHDATVVSINNVPGADLGAINWVQSNASGLSEMMVGLIDDLKTDEQPKLVDQQIATCFLTGIVAQTDRFSNAKTNPQTMSLAAKLMNAGANQQLIATKLEPPAPIPKEPEKVAKPPEPPKPLPPPKAPDQPPAGPPKMLPKPKPPEVVEEPEEKETEDGALLVPHDGITGESVAYGTESEESIAKIHIDDEGTLKRIAEEEAKRAAEEEAKANNNPLYSAENRKMVDNPPALGGELSTSTNTQLDENSSDPLSLPTVEGDTLSHSYLSTQPTGPSDNQGRETLSDLEKSINSPHVKETATDNASNNSSDGTLPTTLIGPDTGLAPDQTAGNPNPSAPPPVPPPLPMTPPPNFASGNMSDPNSGVPF